MIKKILIAIYILLILLYPCQFEMFGITYAKILLVYSSGLLIYQLISLKRKEKLFELINKLKSSIVFYFIIGLSLFTLCILVSNIISIISGNKLYLANIFEILRGFLYIVSTINCFIFFQENTNNKIFFKKILIFSIIFTLFVSFIQYFNFFNINDLYIRYIAPTQYKTLINNYPNPRIVGLTGNPNVFGCLLNIYTIYVLYNIIKSNKINFYYLLFVLLRVAIYMTGTRSAFLLSIISEIVLFVFMIIKNTQVKKIICKVLIIIFCEILMIFSLPNSMTWRIKQLIDLSSIKSWNVRVEHNQDILDDIFTDSEQNKDINNSNNENNNIHNNNYNINEDIIENDDSNNNTKKLVVKNKFTKLLFGVGSDKENHDAKKGENEWLMIFYRYGIVGIISFLMIFVLQLFKIKNNTRIKNALFFAIFILVAVYMVPQGFYHVYNLMLAFILFYSYEMERD